jgi:hypothetical protein
MSRWHLDDDPWGVWVVAWVLVFLLVAMWFCG